MNNQIFYFFYNLAHQSDFLDYNITFLAVYFSYIVIIGAVIFLLIHHEVLLSSSPLKEFKKKWKEILSVFFSGIFGWILAFIFKLFLETPRPLDLLDNITPLFYPTDHSFPSGHATFFFALAFSIFFSHRKIGILFFISAIIISIARITAGVHFPIDILGGILLGFVTSFIIRYFIKK